MTAPARPVPLSELVGALPQPARARDLVVRGLAFDSRTVRPGDLFICLRGRRDDGHRHAAEAVHRGAVALLVEEPVGGLDGIPQVRVADARLEMARVAARFYAEPSARLHVTGVTGTEGKTTTTYLVDAILQGAGYRTARFGTTGYRIGARTEPAALTTPESIDLQRWLAECVAAGVSHVVMEVSSHALAQRRVDRCEFDVAVFTNLHTDHLDFHRTLERYRGAKAALFGELGRGPVKAGRGVGMVNADDPAGWYMRLVCPRPVLAFGLSRPAPVRGRLLAAELGRTVLDVETPQGSAVVALPLTGSFNASNALAALAVGTALGVDLPTMKRALEAMPGVPGRFELIPNARGLVVVVDFAHTPVAFEEVLGFLRRHTTGRLLTVFGCPGDRDRTKRPIIGRLATRQSDLVLITTDNPASEDPAAVADEIARGAREVDPKGDRHRVVLDRAEAVRAAVSLARPGDAILLAGKGHEDCQLVGGARVPYSDRQTAEEALGVPSGIPGSGVWP